MTRVAGHVRRVTKSGLLPTNVRRSAEKWRTRLVHKTTLQLHQVVQRSGKLFLAEDRFELADDFAAAVHEERVGLARQVPFGDGRAVLLELEVLPDLDVDEVDAILVLRHLLQQHLEHRTAEAADAERGRAELDD